jgi:prepilin-type N-terminal cleavage/methylation domain-containing protein
MKIPSTLRGVTLPEVLVSIAIIAVLGAAIIPSYRSYQLRSDVNLAAGQAEHMVRRAQLLAQSGKEASAWGYRAETGTLFLGKEYDTRDTSFDESIDVPNSVVVSGILEVYFQALYGVPSIAGDIVFTAEDGYQKIVTIDSGTLAGPPVPPVQIKVHFDRIKNSGNGAVENKVYVGKDADMYEEDEWIPLTKNGFPIVDSSIVLGVNGLSMQRGDGFVRIVAYGGLDSGGKEVIDATITINRALIDHIENEDGEHEGEQPFDGNSNEGVGGDEYTLAADNQSVKFQTRVTNAGDTILIFWLSGTP